MNNALPPLAITQSKNMCKSVLGARYEALSSKDPYDLSVDEKNELKECTFLGNALDRGWLVSDLPFLLGIHQGINSVPAGKVKLDGLKLLEQIETVDINRVSERYNMLNMLSSYFNLNEPNNIVFRNAATTMQNVVVNKNIYASEFPNDNSVYHNYLWDDNMAISNYSSIVNNKYVALMNENKANVRDKKEYVIDEYNEVYEQQVKMAGFMPHDGQKHNKITKNNSTIINEVFGDRVYDEINEMKRGSLKERTVPLHHADGTKWQKMGEEVLELDFAGSQAKDVINLHKGHDGRMNTEGMNQEEINNVYGKEAQKRNGKKLKYIRYKERTLNVNDKSVNKTRYTFSGPTPDWWWIPGVFNLGEYSIENSRNHAKNIAEDYLTPRFEKWIRGEEQPHPIHVSLSGHSRGAVTAGEAIKKISKWVDKYTKEHPDANINFKDFIQYDLRLKDPVPGIITDLRLGKNDLRKIPNLNATMICSMAQEHTDMVFPLQYVRGAKKVILTTTEHMMDLNDIDESQKTTLGDGASHRAAYFDAETGEMYRGSGINQIPDGVYISDENKNLVRITSYSQLDKITNKLYDNTSPQKTRNANIHKMVRDWFVENHLEMSFPDEITRSEEKEMNNHVQDRILNSPNKRLASVKEEIRTLRNLQSRNANKDQIIQQNKKIIDKCREYMKKTRIPTSGDSAYRINLVGDMLAFTMKENNQLEKELSIARNENKEFALDNKIAAYKNRLDQKNGYLGRKKSNEANRKRKDEQLINITKNIAAVCNKYLKSLNNTFINQKNTYIYEDFHDVLEEGSKLDDTVSINELTDFFKRLTKYSDEYVLRHTAVFKPISKGGQIRLDAAQKLAEKSKILGESIEVAAKGLTNRDMPLNKKLMYDSARYNNAQAKFQRAEAVKMQNQQQKIVNQQPKVAGR
ncbi:MAG: hypothetical protein K6G11_01330 [Lachnospiraceae bacterium]|nr:hypothetical protein [Lachnospiraceae bacterium]